MRKVYVIEFNNGEFTTLGISFNSRKDLKVTGVNVFEGKQGEEIFIKKIQLKDILND
jgi:hypothetical protein